MSEAKDTKETSKPKDAKPEELAAAKPSTQAEPPLPSAAASQPSASSSTTNMMAILSLVFAFLFSLVGLILGIVALNQIKKTGEGGKGLAIAGIILSAINIIVTILFVVFVIILGGIASLSQIENECASGDTACIQEKADKAVEEELSEAVEIDTFTEAGEFRVKVNSVTEYAGEEYFKPKQGNIYLNIELEVMNDGFDTRNVSDFYASIKDSENKKYNPTSLAAPTNSPTISGELPSKDTVKGILGFEVPEKATGLKLYFESGNYDGKVGVINLDR